jgi:hypothetical protein
LKVQILQKINQVLNISSSALIVELEFFHETRDVS